MAEGENQEYSTICYRKKMDAPNQLDSHMAWGYSVM